MPQANIAKRTDLLNYFMMGKSEHETGGHIFEPYPFQIASVIINVRIAQSYRCCISLVMNYRAGHIGTFPTRQLRVKIEVRIFIVKKKLLVQETNFIEHPTAIEHSRPTGTKNEVSLIEQRDFFAEPAIEPDPGRGQPIAGAVDALPVVEEDLGSADSHRRVFKHRLDKTLKPGLFGSGVIIDQSDEFTVGGFKALDISTSKAFIPAQLYNSNSRETFSNKPNGIIRRAIVD